MSFTSSITNDNDSKITSSTTNNQQQTSNNETAFVHPLNFSVNVDADPTDKDLEKDAILCILWKGGKLGAAYYKLSDQQVCIYDQVTIYPTG